MCIFGKLLPTLEVKNRGISDPHMVPHMCFTNCASALSPEAEIPVLAYKLVSIRGFTLVSISFNYLTFILSECRAHNKITTILSEVFLDIWWCSSRVEHIILLHIIYLGYWCLRTKEALLSQLMIEVYMNAVAISDSFVIIDKTP